ncbi:MAG: hypothetical protein ABIL02_00525 [candidate division WOR-3 bacterium]
MGIFREKVKIANPLNGSLSGKIEMIVDSGATYTQIPPSILENLKVEKKYKRVATGEIIERHAGIVNISIKEETLPTIAIFGDEASERLLGAVTLEQFGLAIDPLNKILVPMSDSMFVQEENQRKNFK